MQNKDFDIKDCICAWYDLLGYGQPFVESNWDLDNDNCKKQLERVKLLDLTLVNKFAGSYSTVTFTLNDGVIYNHDINTQKDNFIDKLVTSLDDLISEFEGINIRDVRIGFPGARGIITYGQRYNYEFVGSTVDAATNFTISYHPAEFQMNTAFSKAYIIESSGSKAGISGNNLFIDNFLLDNLERLITLNNNSVNEYDTSRVFNNDDYLFTIIRNNEVFLQLIFDKTPIKYNNKGIVTELFKFKSKDSLLEKIAAEQAFLAGQRYLRMEREEFGDD